jgi:hypothetical protein
MPQIDWRETVNLNRVRVGSVEIHSTRSSYENDTQKAVSNLASPQSEALSQSNLVCKVS